MCGCKAVGQILCYGSNLHSTIHWGHLRCHHDCMSFVGMASSFTLLCGGLRMLFLGRGCCMYQPGVVVRLHVGPSHCCGVGSWCVLCCGSCQSVLHVVYVNLLQQTWGCPGPLAWCGVLCTPCVSQRKHTICFEQAWAGVQCWVILGMHCFSRCDVLPC